MQEVLDFLNGLEEDEIGNVEVSELEIYCNNNSDNLDVSIYVEDGLLHYDVVSQEDNSGFVLVFDETSEACIVKHCDIY